MEYANIPEYIRLNPDRDYKTPSIYDFNEKQKLGLFKFKVQEYLHKYGFSTTLTRVDFSYGGIYCRLLDQNIPIEKIDSDIAKNNYRTIITGYLGVRIFCPYNEVKLHGSK